MHLMQFIWDPVWPYRSRIFLAHRFDLPKTTYWQDIVLNRPRKLAGYFHNESHNKITTKTIIFKISVFSFFRSTKLKVPRWLQVMELVFAKYRLRIIHQHFTKHSIVYWMIQGEGQSSTVNFPLAKC